MVFDLNIFGVFLWHCNGNWLHMFSYNSLYVYTTDIEIFTFYYCHVKYHK